MISNFFKFAFSPYSLNPHHETMIEAFVQSAITQFSLLANRFNGNSPRDYRVNIIPDVQIRKGQGDQRNELHISFVSPISNAQTSDQPPIDHLVVNCKITTVRSPEYLHMKISNEIKVGFQSQDPIVIIQSRDLEIPIGFWELSKEETNNILLAAKHPRASPIPYDMKNLYGFDPYNHDPIIPPELILA